MSQIVACLIKKQILPKRIYCQWGFWQYLPFSWTTLKDKHCRHSIAVMGFVDMFGPELLAKLPRQRYKQMILTLDGVEVTTDALPSL